MKRILRILVAWFLLLALPLQGYAGTHLLMCAAGQGASTQATPAMPHDAARLPPCHRHAANHEATQQPNHAAHHEHAKAGSCAACALLAALAPAAAPRLDLDRPVSLAIPFRARHLPSVHPALPERPPQRMSA